MQSLVDLAFVPTMVEKETEHGKSNILFFFGHEGLWPRGVFGNLASIYHRQQAKNGLTASSPSSEHMNLKPGFFEKDPLPFTVLNVMGNLNREITDHKYEY